MYGPKLSATQNTFDEVSSNKIDCMICMNMKSLQEMQDANCPCNRHAFCKLIPFLNIY